MRRMVIFYHFRHLLLLAFLPFATAQAGQIALVLSQNSGPYAEYARTLDDTLDNDRFTLSVAPTPESFTGVPAGTDAIVAAGPDALRQALSRSGTTPVIATLLTRHNYERVLAESGRPKGRITAIYLDQPPQRQAAFLRHLLPKQKRIGMLVSSDTRPLLPAYRQALQNNGLTLESEESDGEQQLLPVLNNLFARTGALLAIPDNTIYRRDNIRAILLTSYRSQRPVIAFSAAFVQAGALAALYSTPAQIAKQTAELILALGTSLPPPMPPSQFAISINQNVAEAFGLAPLDEATLRRTLLNDKEAR